MKWTINGSCVVNEIVAQVVCRVTPKQLDWYREAVDWVPYGGLPLENEQMSNLGYENLLFKGTSLIYRKPPKGFKAIDLRWLGMDMTKWVRKFHTITTKQWLCS